MGERIEAIVALTRIRAVAAQIPAQAPSPAAAPNPETQQAVNNVAASRPLQELAGLRQMAETTSARITPNTNAQRADVVGSAMSQETESTVPAPNPPEAQQPAADVVAANERNRLSFNRAILETLRGGFETARENVPTIEQQWQGIRQALATQRAERQPERQTEQTAEEESGAVTAPVNRQPRAVIENALGVSPRLVDAYPPATEIPEEGKNPRLNFLA